MYVNEVAVNSNFGSLPSNMACPLSSIPYYYQILRSDRKKEQIVNCIFAKSSFA